VTKSVKWKGYSTVIMKATQSLDRFY